MGFASLQHMPDREVHTPRALPARFGPPSGFGYPLDGLRPGDPGRSCFIPAALMGFTLRSFLLSEGSRPFPADRTHVLFIFRYTTRPKAWGRHGRPQFLGFDPSGSPWRADAGLERHPAGCSPGFRPPRACRWSLRRDFAQRPLTRFPAPPSSGTSASQRIDRPQRPLVRPRQSNRRGEERATPAGFLHRSPDIRTTSIRAMGSPRHATSMTADLRGSLDGPPVLPELSGCRL